MSGKIFLEQIKMLVPPTEDGHLARLMDVEERFAHAQLPANADLNGVWDSGEYYAASASAAASILNKPTDFPTGNYNFLLKVEKPVDSSAFSIQRLSLVSQAAVGSAAEWVRTGDTGSGNWSTWKRLMTYSEYYPYKPRSFNVAVGSRVYVKLLEIITPTGSGNFYNINIGFSGGPGGDIFNQAIGQLFFGVRNHGGTINQISARLLHCGPATINSVQFGYVGSSTPGSTLVLYVTVPTFLVLKYFNFTDNPRITIEGTITDYLTEAPTGYTAIVPSALATA